MEPYIKNRFCRCQRCLLANAMGPAVLITVGVLFLLQELRVAYFHMTFPILLIVIGAILLLRSSASTEGHIQPYGYAAPPQPPPPKDHSQVNHGQ